VTSQPIEVSDDDSWQTSQGQNIFEMAAIIALFRVVNRYVGNLAPMPGLSCFTQRA